MTEAAGLDNYKVDKNLCIDCNACYTTYPEIFKRVEWQGEFKAEEYAPTPAGKINPWDVVGVCPTEAIAKIGEMPPKPEKKAGEEEAAPLEDQGPWEERWARARNHQDSQWEIMKRYGMAAAVTDNGDRFVIKVEFPEKTPHHILKFKLGLPDLMPDYNYEVKQGNSQSEVVVAGKLADPHIKKLCGKINSFPDRFRRSFQLDTPVKIVRERYIKKILYVECLKTSADAA